MYVILSYNILLLFEQSIYLFSSTFPVTGPGFPVGGRGPRRGDRGLPRQLRFEKFVCQNERIWTLRGAWAGHPPIYIRQCFHSIILHLCSSETFYWSFVWTTLLDDRPKPHVCRYVGFTWNWQNLWISMEIHGFGGFDRFQNVKLQISVESADFIEIHSHLSDFNRHTS